MWELYFRNGDEGMPQYAAPMLAAGFSNPPPAYMEMEEFDCLHDESAAYARALQTAGVEVQLENVPGAFHGFDFFTSKRISQVMVQKRVQTLRQTFSR